MTLYLKLDQDTWIIDDYTDVDALAITGTVYSDKDLTTVFDLTGYTLSFRLISQGTLFYDDDQDTSIVTAASGTWKYLPDKGRLSIEGVGEVALRLEKSGTQITAVGINDSANLHIKLA